MSALWDRIDIPGVAVGVGVNVAVDVEVAVGVGVEVFVGVKVEVAVGKDVEVAVGVKVDSAVTTTTEAGPGLGTDCSVCATDAETVAATIVPRDAASTVSVGRGTGGVATPGMTQAVIVAKEIKTTKKVCLLFMFFFLEIWNKKSLTAIIAERLD